MLRFLALIAVVEILAAGARRCSTQDAPDGLKVLDNAEWNRIAQGGALGPQLELLAIRQDLSLLDDKKRMQCFILQSNTNTPTWQTANHEITDEFEYPKLESFYKASAPEALRVVPNTLSFDVSTATVLIGGRGTTQGGIFLGEYDAASHSFPIVDSYNRPETVMIDRVSPPIYVLGCNLGPFTLLFKGMQISRIPMDEAEARAYVASPYTHAAGQGRQISLLFELEIPPNSAHIGPTGSFGVRPVSFDSVVTKISVSRVIAGTFGNPRQPIKSFAPEELLGR
jgi:hypothetical protein